MFLQRLHLQATIGDGLAAVAQLASRLASETSAAPQLQPSHQSASAAPPASYSEQSQQVNPPLSNGTTKQVSAPGAAQGPHRRTADNNAVPSADSSTDSTPQQQQQQQQLDVLVIDAGSGDASQSMSCPPPAFLEAAFLQHARQVLKPEGMLVVNCVSRATEPYQAAVKSLQASLILMDDRLPVDRLGQLSLFLRLPSA